MKIQTASNLHREFIDNRFQDQPPLPYADGTDVLIPAGDIDRRDRAIKAFSAWPVPVVYVSGTP
jgi:hypothetical protein